MKNRLLLILLMFLIFVIYLLSSGGTTPYNYFILLAKQFLEGKYYLIDNPAWLNELIPLKNGGYGVVYPPTPAIIAIPFVYFFGVDFPQNYIAYFLGTAFALTVAKIVYYKTKRLEHFYWALILSAIGNIAWYLSSNGSVWYLGQISGAFFLTATIYESLTRKRPLLVSMLFSLAVFSRIHLVLAFPLIVYLNIKNLNIRRIIGYITPFAISSVLYLTYNYLRFGSIFETGYTIIPGVLEEPWYSKGILHLSYVKDNLKVFLLSLPIFSNTFPYIKPSWGGLSILITTPAFIYILKTKIKDKENIFTIVSLVLIAVFVFSHGQTGFTQFGYRFAVDFYPLMYLLLANYLIDKDLKWHHYLLLILSVLVNLWGIVWINKFGYVSF